MQRYELFIRTTERDLWTALTDGKQTQGYFFGTSVETSLKPGTPIVYKMPDGSVAVDGTIVEAQPHARLVHTWVTRYDPELAKERSKVTWTIERRGEACKLTVEHDLTDAPKTADHVAKDGWSVVLSGLKTLLETKVPLAVG